MSQIDLKMTSTNILIKYAQSHCDNMGRDRFFFFKILFNVSRRAIVIKGSDFICVYQLLRQVFKSSLIKSLSLKAGYALGENFDYFRFRI